MHPVIDQEFYEKKGWGELRPKRCKACRTNQRAQKKAEAVDKSKKAQDRKQKWAKKVAQGGHTKAPQRPGVQKDKSVGGENRVEVSTQ